MRRRPCLTVQLTWAPKGRRRRQQCRYGGQAGAARRHGRLSHADMQEKRRDQAGLPSAARKLRRSADGARLERSFTSPGFRGCPFVNAVAELGEPSHEVKQVAVAFKERRRVWFRDLLAKLEVADPEGLATQLALLIDGAIAGALVRGDPKMAHAAKNAAGALLTSAIASTDTSARTRQEEPSGAR